MQADQIPAEIVEAAARVIDPEAFEVPPRGYSPGAAAQSAEDARGKAAEILAAVYREVQARALEDQRRRVVRFMPAGMVDRATVLADLNDYAARLRTPDAGVGGGERG